jgi:Protein of unknown function (DUF4058)
MPIHDWTRVDAGIFHDFHSTWVVEIKRALNAGLLPSDYYALAEQIASGLGPDVLTLRRPANNPPPVEDPGGGTALATAPPKVRYHALAEQGLYARKTKTVVVRHRSNHKVVAMLEILSPGNKGSRNSLKAFVRKAEDALFAGIHLLLVDLFPPGPRDPEGIHRAVWGEEEEDDFVWLPDKPLTLVAYVGGLAPEAYIEPVAVGDPLPEMPLFLTPEVYVPVPLEATYASAWEAVPSFWRDVLTAPAAP